MHKQPLHQPARMIRFRRWSGKKYAVLCSLHCHVTIGCVSMGIADRALSKTGGMVDCSNGHTGRATCDDDTRERSSEDETVPWIGQDLLWSRVEVEYVSVSKVACIHVCVQGNTVAARCSLVSYFLWVVIPVYARWRTRVDFPGGMIFSCPPPGLVWTGYPFFSYVVLCSMIWRRK